jgi:hypothetical protein
VVCFASNINGNTTENFLVRFLRGMWVLRSSFFSLINAYWSS